MPCQDVSVTGARKKLLLSVMVPIQVVSAVLAWRDIGRRSDAQIRGSRRFWRVFAVMNPGNSLLYWLVGRR